MRRALHDSPTAFCTHAAARGAPLECTAICSPNKQRHGTSMHGLPQHQACSRGICWQHCLAAVTAIEDEEGSFGEGLLAVVHPGEQQTRVLDDAYTSACACCQVYPWVLLHMFPSLGCQGQRHYHLQLRPVGRLVSSEMSMDLGCCLL